MATMTRLPILDDTGKVRLWLNQGRGLIVWRPDQFTPADHVEGCTTGCETHDVINGNVPMCRKPHWAYVVHRVVRDATELLFYAPLHIVRSWPDSPQGIRACEKALATYRDETREAPIGTVYTTYTMKRFTMGSIVIRPDSDGGTILDMVNIPPSGAMTSQPPRLMHVEFRVGIQAWTAIEPTTGPGA